MFSITSENICGFNSKSELRNSSLTFIVRVCGSTRSEEHTSELQSRLHLVCRLLLEKKKTYPEPMSLTHQIILTPSASCYVSVFVLFSAIYLFNISLYSVHVSSLHLVSMPR